MVNNGIAAKRYTKHCVAVYVKITYKRFGEVVFVRIKIIARDNRFPRTDNKSFIAYFCIATKISPMFFVTKFNNVKASATNRALRKSTLLIANVLKNLLKFIVNNGINSKKPMVIAIKLSRDRVVLIYFLPSAKFFSDIALVR